MSSLMTSVLNFFPLTEVSVMYCSETFVSSRLHFYVVFNACF